MELTVLGAGTCIPYPGYSPAGYLVRIGGTPVLLDMGPGTLVRLEEKGVSYRDLDLISDHQALTNPPGQNQHGHLLVLVETHTNHRIGPAEYCTSTYFAQGVSERD